MAQRMKPKKVPTANPARDNYQAMKQQAVWRSMQILKQAIQQYSYSFLKRK